MPTRAIEGTVAFCTDHAGLVVLAALATATAACIYAAQHFAITTDVTQLIAAEDSAWFKNQLAYQAEFPTQAEWPSHKIMVVLDAPTPELADQAADKLAQSISAQSSVIQSAAQPGGGPFFEHNALLFLPEQDVAAIITLYYKDQFYDRYDAAPNRRDLLLGEQLDFTFRLESAIRKQLPKLARKG